MSLKILHEEKYSLGIEPEKRSIAQLLEFGVVPVDKPCGPSSHEVSSFVRKILGVKKTGHSGTLDPEVSGVLPVLLNNSCKLAKLLLGSTKEYVCVMKLGENISESELEKILGNFRGKIYQTPPLESAVKKQLRVREVYSLKVLEKKGELVLFDSRVQGGTYIRRLVRDIGLLAGVEARMLELRRTLAAGIPEKQCITLQELSDSLWLWKEKNDEKPLREVLWPLEKVIKLKKVIVGDDAIKFLCSGADLDLTGVNALDEKISGGETIGIFSGKGELVCVAKALVDASEVIEKASAGTSQKKAVAFDVERVVNSVGQA